MGIAAKAKYFFNHSIVQYYGSHPFILIKNRAAIYYLQIKKVLHHDPNFDDNIKSDIPIDIMMPAIDKDYKVLGYVIDSIRENIKHPIGDIIIISPASSESIKKLCQEKKCVFVDENTVLPVTKKDINYIHNGQDRSGWLLQQFLKWSADKYAKNDYFLITESDTVFSRPQVFIHNNKTILSVCSQLCHIPYFDTYEKLTGEKIDAVYNLTSHHSLFQKSKLAALKKAIEKHCGVAWYQAIMNNIDPNEGSFVSDYDSYGQFVLSRYKNDFKLEHWFNLSLSRANLPDVKKLMAKYRNKYKTISFHSYKD